MARCKTCANILNISSTEICREGDRCEICREHVSPNASTGDGQAGGSALAAANRQPHSRENGRKSTTPRVPYISSTWLRDGTYRIGLVAITRAKHLLEQLDAPFMKPYNIQDEKETIAAKVPCFYDDKQYQRELKILPKAEREELWRKWRSATQAIAEVTESLPTSMRKKAVQALRISKERERLYAARTQLTIDWFLKTINRERKQLRSVTQGLSKLRLFSEDAINSTKPQFEALSAKLDAAEGVVKRAQRLLEPAKEFYLNQRSSSRRKMKDFLQQRLKNHNMVAGLLNYADSGRPVKPESIRQGGFPRYRPERGRRNDSV